MYHLLFEKHPHPLLVYNRNTLQVLAVNEAAKKLYGYTDTEFTKLNIRDIRPEEDQKNFEEFLNKRKSTTSNTGTFRHKKKDGTVIFVEIISNNIEFENIPARLVAIINITDKVITNNALKKEEQIYKTLVDSISEGIIQVDNDDRILFVNERYCEMLGYTRGELLGKIGYEVLMDKEGQELIKQKNKERISGQSSRYRTIMKKKDGTPMHMEIAGAPVYNSNGEVVGSLGIHTDITDRIKKEKQINWLATFPEQNPNPVIEINNSGNVSFTNISADKIFPDLKLIGKEHPALGGFNLDSSKFTPENNFTISTEITFGEQTYEQKIIYMPGMEIFRIFLFDVTERKLAKIAIQESEEKFRSLVENSLVGVYLVQDNLFKYVNPKLAEIFGYQINEIINKIGPTDIISPEDWKIVSENLRKRLNGEIDSVNYEFNGITKNGELLTVEVFGSRTTYQRKPAVVGTLLDITARKNAELSLREKEESYRNLINSSKDAIYVLKGRNLVLINPAWEALFGYSSEEALSPKFDIVKIIDEESLPFIMERFKIADKGNMSPARYEMKALTKSGVKIVVEVNVSEILWKGEHAVQGIYRDITERKNAERILRESEEKYRDLFEFAPVGIYQSTYDGKIITANKQFTEILGYSSIHEVMKHNMNEFYADDKLRDQLIVNNLSNNLVKNIELEWERKDGKKIWITLDAHVISKSQSEIYNFEGFVRDISDKKQAELLLVKAKENAEEANRLKTGFLSTVSHEIRSPLNAILGFTSILKELYYENSDDEEKQFFISMEEAGNRLLDTITQVLDISRLEAHEFSLNIIPISITANIVSANNILRVQAEKKGLKIKLDLPEKEIILKTDEYCLGGVLMNLVSNAIKYSKKGTIIIKLEEFKDKIVCSIQDEGVGMSEDYMKHLFQTFSQEDVGLSRRFEGTGLGLAITKRYIELLNGTIDVKSKKDFGTTVKFTLPKK